ncbi:MAG: septum formation inhibitor Maf [Acholeplasmataceae bacterium]|mgnify:FL=1|nr:septum formation inhibitor Maf [Acholeplasmataceae bacterium]
MSKFILASNSPRRKELMELIGWEYEIITANIEENVDPELNPEEAVTELAFQKALAVFRHHKDKVVLGFDTLVYTDGKIYGKPKDAQEARRMLKELAGKTHAVVTGVAIMTQAKSKSFFTKTLVTFYPMSDKEIEEYVATGEPLDKAGAYAIQGVGSRFVETIQGDYFTIVGMPIARLYQELKEMQLL